MESFEWNSHLFSSPEYPCLKNFPSQVHCYVFLLHQVEEGKGDDGNGGNDGHAFAIWEPGWRDISVIVISLS